ncbi:MAG: lysylphosphatidylglycerol synthase domain-containing protein [Anaerolineae bacterium]
MFASPVVRLLVLAVALAFLAAVLRSQLGTIRQYRFHVRLDLLVLSYVPLTAACLFEVWLWRRLLKALGYALPMRRAAGVWFLSNLVRYIPGNVWQFLGMMELAAGNGVPRPATLASVALHQLLSNLAGLCLGAAVIGRSGVLGQDMPALVAVFVALAVVVLSPPVLRRLLGFAARLSGSGGSAPSIPFAVVLSLFAGYCLYWVACGFGFALLSTALGMPPSSTALWIAAYAGAYVVGYLSLLTPSGIGVREGVLALLLATVASSVPGALLAVAARLWTTVGELAITGAVAALERRQLLNRGS